MDYALAEAVKMYEDERCPKCGVPTWYGYSTNPEIDFKLDEHTCYACAHKEEEESKSKKDEPGVTRTVRAVHVDGPDHPLPERADFYRRLAVEQEAKLRALAEEED